MIKHMLYIVETNPLAVHEYALSERILLGRKQQEGIPMMTVSSRIVSKTHGEFVLEGEHVLFRDLDSSNGTYINGIRYGIKGEKKEKNLEDGDVLKISTADDGGFCEDAVVILYRKNVTLEVKQWQTLNLSDTSAVIRLGRDAQNCNLHVDDRRVSRIHASFFYAAGGWAVADYESANGVYVNNQRIQQAVYLRPLDCVQMVDYLFLYMGDALLIGMTSNMKLKLQQPRQRGVGSFAATDLCIHIEKRTAKQGFKTITLLKDIDLTIHSGEMVLILGGSGAGKTTLMNAIMGYEKADGTIRYGDLDIYKQYSQMKYKIGFVPQDTLLRENDSVYDTLYNAAQMKLPGNCTAEQLKKRVNEVLDMVNLAHVSNSLIKSISGGEKKRVSAGVELVNDPNLFFLDEPDSGLDAQSATELMENLRQIANTGKIVMIISHSPDRAAKLFDKVIVLAKSRIDNCGHLAFYGSVPQAYDFFETKTLESVVGKINSRDGSVEKYIERWSRQGYGN